MRKNEFSFRVRYGETDQMGVVYHGKYADYLEIGRTEWLRTLGVTYKRMEEEGVILPVINLNIKYVKSAMYDDVLTIKTTLREDPLVKITFDYVIKNQDGDLLAEASTVLAFINSATNRPMKCPDYILEKLD